MKITGDIHVWMIIGMLLQLRLDQSAHIQSQVTENQLAMPEILRIFLFIQQGLWSE